MALKLTTVKLLEELYKEFKTISFAKEFTLQKLVNRSMDLYVSDKKFKNHMDVYPELHKKKLTRPFLNKYERSKVISIRAQQISQNAIPLIEINKRMTSEEIAEKEFELGRLPFLIKRIYPNGEKCEIWKLEEMV